MAFSRGESEPQSGGKSFPTKAMLAVGGDPGRFLAAGTLRCYDWRKPAVYLADGDEARHDRAHGANGFYPARQQSSTQLCVEAREGSPWSTVSQAGRQ